MKTNWKKEKNRGRVYLPISGNRVVGSWVGLRVGSAMGEVVSPCSVGSKEGDGVDTTSVRVMVGTICTELDDEDPVALIPFTVTVPEPPGGIVILPPPLIFLALEQTPPLVKTAPPVISIAYWEEVDDMATYRVSPGMYSACLDGMRGKVGEL